MRDQLSGLAGADAATTSITYDLAGRKTQMGDPDMGTWYYGYDDLGHLKHQLDAVKPNNLWRATCFYYDGHNRLQGQTYPTGIASPTSYACPADPGVYSITYAYDSTAGGNAGLGRRTAMTDTSGSAAWVYDLRGRMTQETKVISGAGTFVTQWGYDSADRVQSLTYPGGSGGQLGEVVTHTYNARGLLKTVIGTSVYVTNTWYNPAGQVTDRMFGSDGSVRQNYSYSQANNFRLTTLKSGAGPTYDTQQNLSYAYDAAGNVRVITDTAALWGGQQVQSFSYDDLNRLKLAQADGGSGSYSQKVYLYNPVGNLTSFENAEMQYQDNNHKHGVTHVGGVQKYWYDANGNVTQRSNGGQTITMTYDAENRLTGLSGAVTETHVYDGDGQRVKAVVTTTVSTTSVFIGASYEVQGSITKTYYYAGNVRVAERNGGVLHWLLSDHLGGTNVTLRADGTFSTTLRYLPYGDTRYNGSNQITTYRFTGQRWNSGTGLYFYNARWYDPYIGRFLAPDTLVPNPGNPQALNRYSYTLNNPLRYTDPTGHWPCRDGICEPASRSPQTYGWVQLPSSLVVSTLADLRREPDDMLLARATWAEVRDGPEAEEVAASILVRAASNFGWNGGFGNTVTDQVLYPSQYSEFDFLTAPQNPPPPVENSLKALNPRLEGRDAGEQTFKKVYVTVKPMYDAVRRGDYSVLPPEFTGPGALNSFVSVGGQTVFSTAPYGQWPWPGLKQSAPSGGNQRWTAE